MLFKKCITTEQMEEVCSLALEEGHEEALTAYGGDMYQQGIKDTTIAAGIAFLLGAAGYAIFGAVKKFRQKRKDQKEEP